MLVLQRTSAQLRLLTDGDDQVAANMLPLSYVLRDLASPFGFPR
jgi:hypothetical protein